MGKMLDIKSDSESFTFRVDDTPDELSYLARHILERILKSEHIYQEAWDCQSREMLEGEKND